MNIPVEVWEELKEYQPLPSELVMGEVVRVGDRVYTITVVNKEG